MNTLGVIPARGGSKAIPGKNIKRLAGRPLIEYTINAAKESILDEICVSTDSARIADVANSLGVRVIMRPESLGTDDTPTLPVVQHAVRHAAEDYDYIVTLQPTSPFRTYAHINAALSMMAENIEADSLVSITKVPHNMSPYSILSRCGSTVSPFIKQEQELLRRQEKPQFFARNGAAIYITPVDNLKHFIFGGKVLGFEMDRVSSLDIDELEDFKLAEAILSARRAGINI